jgi:hypothetical protein
MTLHCTCRRCGNAFETAVADDLLDALTHKGGQMRPNVCGDCDQPDKPLSDRERTIAEKIGRGSDRLRDKALVGWGNLLAAQRRTGTSGRYTSSQLYAITRLTKMIEIVKGQG